MEQVLVYQKQTRWVATAPEPRLHRSRRGHSWPLLCSGWRKLVAARLPASQDQPLVNSPAEHRRPLLLVALWPNTEYGVAAASIASIRGRCIGKPWRALTSSNE